MKNSFRIISTMCTNKYITCSLNVYTHRLMNYYPKSIVAKKITLLKFIHPTYTLLPQPYLNSLYTLITTPVKIFVSTNYTGPTTTTTYLINKEENKNYHTIEQKYVYN